MKKSILIAAMAVGAFAQTAEPNFPLRSIAYDGTMQGITHADNSIGSLIYRPNLAGNGTQLISLEPGTASSFNGTLITQTSLGVLFGNFSKAKDTMTSGQLGWATPKGNWGVSVFWGSDTHWDQNKTGVNNDINATRTNELLDQMGVGASMNLGALTPYARFFVVHGSNETKNYVNDDKTDYVDDYTGIIDFGAHYTTSAFTWDNRLTLGQDDNDSKTGNTVVKSKSGLFGFYSEIGFPIPSKAKDLKPFLGAGVTTEVIDPTVGYQWNTSIFLKFAAEYQLFEHWNVLGGYTYSQEYSKDMTGDEDYTSAWLTRLGGSAMRLNAPYVSGTPMAGLTYHNGAFRVEAKLAADVADVGPGAFFSADARWLGSTALMWSF